MKKRAAIQQLALLAGTVLLAGLDQISKKVMTGILRDGTVLRPLPGILELEYVENRGMAFGLMQGKRGWFLLFYGIAMALIWYSAVRPPVKKHKLWSLALVLTAGGATGNAIDRLLHSYVTDFISFKLIDFPVFNLADCFVVCGCALMCLLLLTDSGEERD